MLIRKQMMAVLMMLTFVLMQGTDSQLAGQSPPAQGEYFSDDGVQIALQQGGAGHLVLLGQQIGLSWQQDKNGQISGSYSILGIPIPFQATVTAAGMQLVSNGERFQLQRRGGAVAKIAEATEEAVVTSEQAGAAVSSISESGDAVMKNQVVDKYRGVRFKIPKGWQAQEMQDGYLLRSQTEKGAILVTSNEYTSLAAMEKEARAGFQDEEGTSLEIRGSVSKLKGGLLAAHYHGLVEWQKARAFAVGLISPRADGGVSILAAVEAGAWTKRYENYALSIARSFKFFKPEIPPVVHQWRKDMSGVRLTYLWSYNSSVGVDGSYAGGSQKTVIDLCQRGYFNYYDSNSMSVDGGYATGYNATVSGGGSDEGSGTWEIVAGSPREAELLLKFRDGRVFRYALSDRDGKTFLGERRYFRTWTGDNAPDCR